MRTLLRSNIGGRGLLCALVLLAMGGWGGATAVALERGEQDLAVRGGAAAEAATGGAIALRHRTVRNWDLVLPEPQLTGVGTALDFVTGLGHRFAVRPEGTALRVDSDGDGETDVRVEKSGTIVQLRGRSGSLAVRFENRAGWKFRSTSVRRGVLEGTSIRLIDQNNNGRFDDLGADAIILGKGRHAAYLSRVLRVGGELLEVRVSPDGTRLEYQPFHGATGTLKVALRSRAKLLSAIVRSEDSVYSFDLAGVAGSVRLPVGRYLLRCGEFGLGSNRMAFARGRSSSFEVRVDHAARLALGGPVRAEFAYDRNEERIDLSPQRVWYYGRAGELYLAPRPIGKSPRFTFRNRRTGRQIAQAFFPGTC